jgi:hypothetical protein
VPVLAAFELLACTAKATVPVPFPLLPDVMEIHEALLAALQLQPDWVVTEKLLLLAALLTFTTVEPSE